jgi:hypothetical protein
MLNFWWFLIVFFWQFSWHDLFGRPLVGHWIAIFSISDNWICTKFGILLYLDTPPVHNSLPISGCAGQQCEALMEAQGQEWNVNHHDLIHKIQSHVRLGTEKNWIHQFKSLSLPMGDSCKSLAGIQTHGQPWQHEGILILQSPIAYLLLEAHDSDWLSGLHWTIECLFYNAILAF